MNNHERDENVSGEEWLSLFKVKLLFGFLLYNEIIMMMMMIIQQQSEEYKVHEMNSPPLITLVKDKMNSTTLEEAIFIAHGIILEKDLPPIKLERYDFNSRLHILVQY